MIPAVSIAARAAVVAWLAGSLAACSTSAPSRPAPPPQLVNELQELSADGTPTQAFPQYWKRNTLIIDLQAAASSGKLTLRPRDGHKWPVRLAFRAKPGTLGVIEVRADQRMLIPVTREGTQPIDIELMAGVYTPKTEQLTLQWGQ